MLHEQDKVHVIHTVSLSLQEPAAHGLSQKAIEIASPFGMPITNSMIATWAVAIALIVFARISTRRMAEVPSGVQNLFEWLVEGLYGLLEGILGRHLVERTFWFFATVFIFILTANWLGLVPGVGTIGWGHHTSHGFVVEQPLLRGANADLNMTLAMALVFFACWIVWAIQEVGVRGMFTELFTPKGETAGWMRWLMIVVFFAAGCLEVISILFRPVSLSFRLYGNIFAGENMLETHGHAGARSRLAAADSVLLHGAVGGARAGDGLHAADRRLHASHLSARARRQHATTAQRRARLTTITERTSTMNGSVHIGLAALGAAIAVGMIGYGGAIAVGRNPGASAKVMVQSILAIAFAEAIVFYALFLAQ